MNCRVFRRGRDGGGKLNKWGRGGASFEQGAVA